MCTVEKSKVAAYSWCHEGLGVPLSRSGGLTCTPLISPARPYLIVSLSPERSPAVTVPVFLIPLSLSLSLSCSLTILYFVRVYRHVASRRKNRIHTVAIAAFLLFAVLRGVSCHSVSPLKKITWRYSFRNPRFETVASGFAYASAFLLIVLK